MVRLVYLCLVMFTPNGDAIVSHAFVSHLFEKLAYEFFHLNWILAEKNPLNTWLLGTIETS